MKRSLGSKDATATSPMWRATGFQFHVVHIDQPFFPWVMNKYIIKDLNKNLKVSLKYIKTQYASLNCRPTLCCVSCVFILSGSLAISSSESKDFSDSSSHSISLLQASWNCKEIHIVSRRCSGILTTFKIYYLFKIEINVNEMLKFTNSTFPLKKRKVVVSSADYKLSCSHLALMVLSLAHFIIIHSST